jgi:2,4-dienoyl-CoA reductase-like NADH-dependent reductase (Old Yellow Enzyme family)
MSVDLFQPFRIGKLELGNRFVRSATWDGSADESGRVTNRSMTLYRKLGRGEIGLIVTGHAFVSILGQATPGQYGIHHDDMIPGLRRLTLAVHNSGGKIAVQIAHAGINSGFLEKQDILVPAVSADMEVRRPHYEMTDEDIETIISDFAAAARRAVEAGFDAVQLHGAHGYLMSQFLSPVTNRRRDRWGGNPENRRRFHLEVVSRIRKTVGPDFPVLIKFGVMDDVANGLSIEEGLETARQMQANAVDAIEVSGGLGGSAVSKGEAYYRDRAAAVKHVVSIPVIAVAGIRSLQTAQSIVDTGDADLISMSRPFIREPGLIARWKTEKQGTAKCISCSRCFIFPSRGLPLQCGQDNKLKVKNSESNL